MWTGGKPPSIPESPLPPPSAQSFRPGSRDAELEALRQRGLAKLLNKHFTETTKKLAQEKAAADAALRDLEARKAATSKFEASKDGQLSPWEQLYLSVHQWRNECRQKERETLLLYQRYVHKFGFTGQIKVPTATLEEQAAAAAITSSPISYDSPPTAAPPPSTPEVVPKLTQAIETNLEEYLQTGADQLPSMETLGKDASYQALYHKEEAEFRNFYRRQLEQKGVDVKASPPGGDKEDPFLKTVWDGDDSDNDDDDMLSPLYLHNQDDDDLDSIISGLTSVNSAVTREILHDCERTVVEFLKEEKESIRKIIVQEEDSRSCLSSSEVGSVAVQAAEQAETMVKQMQEILQDFESHAADGSSNKEPRPYPTSNPDEEWTVYYDDSYEREYFHEKKTNRTQWQAPETDSTSVSSHPAVLLSHDEVVPEVGDAPALSRIALYRRKQRRRRKRRLMLLGVLATISLCGGGYYYYHTTKMAAQLQQEQETQARVIKEQRKLQEKLQAEKEKAERLKLERLAEQERIARQEAERQEALYRPMWCNIPFSYLGNGRCRRLARENPVFDLQELVNAMLQ